MNAARPSPSRSYAGVDAPGLEIAGPQRRQRRPIAVDRQHERRPRVARAVVAGQRHVRADQQVGLRAAGDVPLDHLLHAHLAGRDRPRALGAGQIGGGPRRQRRGQRRRDRDLAGRVQHHPDVGAGREHHDAGVRVLGPGGPAVADHRRHVARRAALLVAAAGEREPRRADLERAAGLGLRPQRRAPAGVGRPAVGLEDRVLAPREVHDRRRARGRAAAGADGRGGRRAAARRRGQEQQPRARASSHGRATYQRRRVVRDDPVLASRP
jgi:hypothetical protein